MAELTINQKKYSIQKLYNYNLITLFIHPSIHLPNRLILWRVTEKVLEPILAYLGLKLGYVIGHDKIRPHMEKLEAK